ncbi:sulfite exporter TauE/SafE family protein [Patescibacteria group bacterium]|nr:sulfite exporter TauE/SafE family protein [Patescibacteria group bacterium]
MFNIYSGFLAGLSVGIYCIGTCLPLFMPILMSNKRTTKSIFLLVLEFSLGRLLGYLLFGFIIGYLGQITRSGTIHLIVGLASIWTGILMVLYSLGTIDKKMCAFLPFSKIKWALLVGFLTGVNICPPFLASLTHVFNLMNVLWAVLYFFLFFLGTSVYIIPMALFGVFTKSTVIQKLAQVSGVLIGIYFIVKNFFLFL